MHIIKTLQAVQLSMLLCFGSPISLLVPELSKIAMFRVLPCNVSHSAAIDKRNAKKAVKHEILSLLAYNFYKQGICEEKQLLSVANTDRVYLQLKMLH